MLALIQVKRSMRLIIFALVLYTGAGLAVCLSQLRWYFVALLFLLLALSAKRYFTRFILLTDLRAVVAFSKPGTFWMLQMVNQDKVCATLKHNSLITRFLLVLNFTAEESLSLTMILTPDSIGLQDFRRLLVYLLHSHKCS